MLEGGVAQRQPRHRRPHQRHRSSEGSLPLGSLGTATLFLGDTRIATNVRLFEGQRALGTRVSRAVRDQVLGAGRDWLGNRLRGERDLRVRL